MPERNWFQNRIRQDELGHCRNAFCDLKGKQNVERAVTKLSELVKEKRSEATHFRLSMLWGLRPVTRPEKKGKNFEGAFGTCYHVER